MVTGADIEAEARSWIRTPYRHQGRTRGRGVDCIGLVIGVMQGLEMGSQAFWQAIARRWRHYHKVPDGHTLHDALSAYMPEYPRTRAQAGDVLLIRIAGAPRHVAILTEAQTLIHAYADIGRCVETRWAGAWRNDTTGAFRITEFAPSRRGIL